MTATATATKRVRLVPTGYMADASYLHDLTAAWRDVDYVPPCRKHHVEDCPDVDCQIAYAMEGY